jgi:transposase
MNIPKNLTLRQTLEGMPLTFNPQAADGLEAIIQFEVSGAEPGVYHLRIANGECSFHDGAVQTPSITIITPSEVWMKISRGELTGYDALMSELYTATGEITLLMKMDSLFGKASDIDYVAPASQRPSGPISLKGMDWLTIAFIPWIIHWSTFDIPNVSHWISVGLPLLFSALIVGYRLFFSRPSSQFTNPQPPTFMEWGGLGMFLVAAGLAFTGAPGYAEWGSVVSGFVMAALWLSSLQFASTPLSAEYSKWGFVKGYQQALRELVDRRQQLLGMLEAESCRLDQSRDPFILRSLRRSLRTLRTWIQACEKQIHTLIDATPALKAAFDRLILPKGVGPCTAWAVLAYMPELGSLDRKEAAALAGIAPFNDDSGQHRGKRYIQGGRFLLRRSLYMAALVSSRHNPILRNFYQRLVDAGKPKKAALIAVCRKLVVLLNRILQDSNFSPA